MIQIKNKIISTVQEFQAAFDLAEMEKAAHAIAYDEDIFVGFPEYESPFEALSKVLKGADLSVTQAEGDKICWQLDSLTGACSGKLAAKEGMLTGIAAVRFILCALGNKPFAATDITETPTQAPKSSHDGEEIILTAADSDDAQPIVPHRFSCTSLQGKATIQVVWPGQKLPKFTIELPAGSSIVALLKGNGIAAVIPAVSRHGNNAVYARMADDQKMQVVMRNLSTGEEKLGAAFPAASLTQVCADSMGGYLALVEGKIYTYSRVIMPDEIEDMCLPTDDKVVMLAVSGQQLLALTASGRTYSNYRTPAAGLSGILRIGLDSDGAFKAEKDKLSAIDNQSMEI